MELLNKACTGKNAFSCYYISGIFIQGVKDLIDKDMTKAFQYSLKACDLGNMYACANVSQVVCLTVQMLPFAKGLILLLLFIMCHLSHAMQCKKLNYDYKDDNNDKKKLSFPVMTG